MATGFCLRVLGRDFKLLKTLTIGRANSCTIPLDDILVSRTHASVSIDGERVVVEDLRSRNGVFVNGERVAGTRDVVAGDVILIGNHELTVVVGESDDLLDGHTITLKNHREDDTPVSQALPVEFVTIGGKEYAVIPKDVYLAQLRMRATLDSGTKR